MHIETPSLGRRFVAFLIDSSPFSLLAVVTIGITNSFAIALILAILLYKVYQTLFIGIVGQTLGKASVGVRIVKNDKMPPGIPRAILREVVGKFFSWIILVPFLIIYLIFTVVLMIMAMIISIPVFVLFRRLPTILLIGGASWGSWRIGGWVGSRVTAMFMPWIGGVNRNGQTLYDHLAGTWEILQARQ